MTATWYKTTPDPIQLEAVRAAGGRPAFALFMKMGTGKTKIFIDEANILYRKGLINAGLVITLNGLQQNWHERELPKHSAVDYKSWCFSADEMTAKQRRAWSDAITRGPTDKMQWFLINFEALNSPKVVNQIKLLIRTFKCYGVIDESHKLKSPTGKISRIVRSFAPSLPFRRLGTGTPQPHDYLDLWAPFMFLDPQIMGHPEYTTFKAEYAEEQRVVTKTGREKMKHGGRLVPGRDYFMKVIGFQKIPQLRARMDPFIYTADLDMGEVKLNLNRMTVMLTNEQRTMYNDLAEELLASTNAPPEGLTKQEKLVWLAINADVAPKNTLVKLLRMQQVASGFVENDDGTIVELPSRRPEYLQDALATIPNEPAIIWCRFQRDVEQLLPLLGEDKTAVYYGPTPPKERTAAVDAFAAGEKQYFLGTAAAGGTGLTLLNGYNMFFYSMDSNAATWQQAVYRAYRRGQTKNVTVTTLVSAGTNQGGVLSTVEERIERSEEMYYRD